jgi:hypothetical protein
MITPVRRGIVCAGYCNHIDGCTDQWGNMYGAATRKDPGQPEELVICRRQHATGALSTLAVFPADADTKYGYSTLQCIGPHLVIWASERQPDGTTPIVEYLLPNTVMEFAATYTVTRRATLRAEPASTGQQIGRMPKAREFFGTPVGDAWVAWMEEGEVVGYVKAEHVALAGEVSE